ncbi:TPA: epoxyqueuosine reductase QueH, partial [Candidatus Galligastranaerophilus gallistercoris]|nr:epoxyqueuosine reductase QueH [Candidatus Galligastranaerophilus gallistercoris]
PHKISKDIFEYGQIASKEHNIEFLNFDFKKKDGYKKSCKIAYDFGMYRQNYCGCEFSIN